MILLLFPVVPNSNLAYLTMEDSKSTWLKCFGDGFNDDDVAFQEPPPDDSNHGTSAASTGVLERAAKNISLEVEERRYLEHINDIDNFIPTQDRTSIWLQCFAGDGRSRITETNNAIDTSTIRMLMPSHKGLTQSELDHDYLRKQGIACGFTVGKWMIKTTEDHVDDIWRLLATKLLDGSLPCADGVKCATARNAKKPLKTNSKTSHQKYRYTICVYTNNGLADKDSVMELRQALHELNIEQKCICPLYWKPDLYTMLPVSGTTYLWIDGVDTKYWCNHWKKTEDGGLIMM